MRIDRNHDQFGQKKEPEIAVGPNTKIYQKVIQRKKEKKIYERIPDGSQSGSQKK
jgi:hypothetical protein